MSDEQRLRGVLAPLVREPETEDRADTPGLIEAATKVVGSTLERWARAAPLRRLLGGVERDVLTRPGEWVALEAKLRLGGKLVRRGRFLLDGERVAEAEISDDGILRAMIRAPAPGIYRVEVELDTRAPVGHALLQVAQPRAVILIDAGLLLDDVVSLPSAALASLQTALREADFELAYFDIGEVDRHADFHAALEQLGQPPAALLAYAAEAQAVEGLGLDLARIFGVTAVHRLRGIGVAITTIVTHRFARARERLAPISVLDPFTTRNRLAADGLDSEHEHARRFLAAHARADPVSWRLDQTTNSTLVPGNTAVVELDNHRARTRIAELIESAHSSIHLQVYIIRPSAVAEELVVRLIRRARSGVRVRFMVDALYSEQEILGRINPLLRSLEAEPNIEILALQPIETRHELDYARLKQRDHRKLLIVDGRRAVISGRNLSDEYYQGFDEVPIHDHTPHERIPWLDAHVELSGPIVAQIQRCFVQTWTDEGGATIDDEDALFPDPPDAEQHEADTAQPPGETAVRFVVHHGLVDANGLAMYESLLDLAEDHVYIVNDFPIVSTLERAILRLLARDVRVQLLTGNAAARRADGHLFPAPVYRTLFEHMVKARLEPLMRAGVEIYEYATPSSPTIVARGGRVRPYVHAKLMSVDGRLCSIGSANLDATASFWESEANVVIEEPAFTAALEAQLAEMIAGSVRLDPRSDYWQRERAQRAVVGKLWPSSLYS